MEKVICVKIISIVELFIIIGKWVLYVVGEDELVVIYIRWNVCFLMVCIYVLVGYNLEV